MNNNEIIFELEPTHTPKGWKWGYVGVGLFILWILVEIIF
jgi:hypothetical protein